MMVKVLVTGAAGFIGTNVVEQLLEKNHTVVALSNRAVPERALARWHEIGAEIHIEEGDVRDAERLREVMKAHRVQRVIHGAVVTSDAQREKTAGNVIIDVNLAGTANIVTVAGECEVERFVYVGSAGVYSEERQPDGRNLDEDVPHEVSTLYGISKSAAEGIVARVGQLWSLSHVTGRVGTAFGPWEFETGFRDTMSPLYQLTRLAVSGKEAIIPFDKIKNWHYARDAAAALVRLAEAQTTDHTIYNLGPSQSWALTDWCNLLQTRYPDFSYKVAAPGNVEVYGEAHGGRLSSDRFQKEFGPSARFGLQEAFDDYMLWLEQHQIFG